MDLGEEYAGNVPVLTYAFDQSFLDYSDRTRSGSRQAIQIMNDLPPAASMILSNFPFNSKGVNNEAGSRGLYDLKSADAVVACGNKWAWDNPRAMFSHYAGGIQSSYSNPMSTIGHRETIPDLILEREFCRKLLVRLTT